METRLGTMRQRSAGTWELIVSTGRDPSTGKYGRVIRTVECGGKREARAALAQLEVEVRAGKLTGQDITVAQLLDRWMEHLRAKGRSANTLYGYERYIKRELVPALGHHRLSKLTVMDVDRLYNDMLARKLAPATVRQAHAVLRGALTQAEKWGLIGRNVARLASPPAMPQREIVPPSAEDVRALMTAATTIDPLLGAYVRLVAATGMRRGEACAIRWTDLDLDAGTLSVERSHVVLPGVRKDQGTKNRSARSIALDDETVDQLRVVRTQATDPLGYMFSNDGGVNPWRPDCVTAGWARVRRSAGVAATVRLHDLRHWQATQLLDAGVALPTVAARLGHANGTTTLAIYAHRTVKGDEAAAELVGQALSGLNEKRRVGN